MKRVLIILAVTILHIVVIGWFLTRTDGDSPPPSGDAPDPVDATQADESHGTGETDTAAPPRTGSATTASLKRLHLRDDARALPPAMADGEATCTTGILIDWSRKRVLWEKKPDTPVPIASMTKMMTALLLVEAVKHDPLLSLATPVKATKTASVIGGRQVYLDFRETFTVDELLKCIMIFSANDVAWLTAEFLAGGDVDTFVERMNRRAQHLGMTQTRFRTPSGLPPASGQEDVSTAREMAFLAAQLLEYPAVTKWSSTWLSYIREDSERFDRFQLVNTNRLVRESPGVNGMKTGYTDAAGFCIAATCERHQRVLIAVVTGCPTADARNDFVKHLLDWGYSR